MVDDVRVLKDLDELVDALIERRRDLRLSQVEVAERIGSSASSVSLWESGKATPGSVSLFAWADALGVDLALVPRGDR